PLAIAHDHRVGVEPADVAKGKTALAKAGGEVVGEPMDAPGDSRQALGAVVDRVAGADHRQQYLGGADIGVGFFPADVLLPCLHRHAQGGLAPGVDGYADDAPGGGALVVIAEGEKGGVGAAETHGNAKALVAADDNVGAEAAR